MKIAETYIARKQRLQDRRDDFALETLLSLQRALVELREAVGKINRFQLPYSLEHGRPWSTAPLSPEAIELSDNATRSQIEVLIFLVRVQDDTLRDTVEECVAIVRVLGVARFWRNQQIDCEDEPHA